LARASKDPFGLTFALTWASVLRLLRREWASARELGAEAAAVGAEQSFPMLEAVARMAELAGIGIETGDPAVPALYLAALGRAAATGNQLGVSMILAYLAEVYLAQGNLAETIGTADMALGAADATGQHCYDAVLLQIKGEALRSVPGHDDAEIEAIFRDAIQRARAQGARSFELRAATSLARLLTDLGRGAGAREDLQAVYDTFSQGCDVPDLRSARALLLGALRSDPLATG
jgi:predicted ATPase